MTGQDPIDTAGQRLQRAREAVAADPDSAIALLKLGTVLLNIGRWNEAETELRRAVEIDPACAGAWVNLGGISLARWDFEGCVEANTKAVAADPEMVMAHYNRGLGFLYLKRPEDMLTCFERVLELEPKNPGGQYHMAVAQFALGETEAARARLAIALDLGYSPQPDFIKALERSAPAGVTVLEVGSGNTPNRDEKPQKQH